MGAYIESQEERVKYEDLEIALAEAVLTLVNTKIDNLGRGISFFRNGEYLGYHVLSDEVLERIGSLLVSSTLQSGVDLRQQSMT